MALMKALGSRDCLHSYQTVVKGSDDRVVHTLRLCCPGPTVTLLAHLASEARNLCFSRLAPARVQGKIPTAHKP